MSVKPERIDRGQDVDECFDRMTEIIGLVTPTAHADARIEYSALLCAAAMIMTVHRGMEPTYENCTQILDIMAGEVIPAITELTEDL